MKSDIVKEDLEISHFLYAMPCLQCPVCMDTITVLAPLENLRDGRKLARALHPETSSCVNNAVPVFIIVDEVASYGKVPVSS